MIPMEMTTREVELKKLIIALVVVVVILCGVVVFNLQQIRNIEKISAGSYIPMLDCYAMIDQECGTAKFQTGNLSGRFGISKI